MRIKSEIPGDPRKSVLRPLTALLLLLPLALNAGSTNMIALHVEPSKEYPRSSEGSFATLTTGRIIFCYTQFYGGGADHSPARIVRIHSDDQGRTWSPAPCAFVASASTGCGSRNFGSVSRIRLSPN